jgi:hypothetical protein
VLQLPGAYTWAPTASETVFSYTFTQEAVFPAGFSQSLAWCYTPATANATFTVEKNGGSIGTLLFGLGLYFGAFSVAAEELFAAGDVLTLVAPASPDATLARLNFLLACEVIPQVSPVPSAGTGLRRREFRRKPTARRRPRVFGPRARRA